MNKTVMIVEDDEAIRENLRDILEMEGYSALEAVHGKQALEVLAASAGENRLPAVILLDLNMAVMSGRDFLNEFRLLDQHISNIPVIVMTAVPHVRDLGTTGFLKKPINLDLLLSELQRLSQF
jgi:CheY-like chemotaxis protein